MFMLILSIQEYKHVQMVYSTGYTPNILYSEYVYLSPRYTEAYMKMAEELFKKDGTGDPLSFFWGWVKNPYLDFYALKGIRNKVGLFIEVPENRVVVSDYDMYCAYLDEEVSHLTLENHGQCLQGVFKKISPSNIISVVDLKDLMKLYRKGHTSLSELYNLSRVKDIKYRTDIFSLPDYSFNLGLVSM